MPSKYESTTEKLTKVISENIVSLKGEETKFSRFVGQVCIKGYKEKQVLELLKQYKASGSIGVNEKEDILIPFIS